MEDGGLRVKKGERLKVKNEGGCFLEDGLVWYINCLHTSFGILHLALSYQRDMIALINKFMIHPPLDPPPFFLHS